MKFYKVDTDAVPAVSNEVGIRAMPTFIAFQNGKKVGTVLGARPQEIKVRVCNPHPRLPLNPRNLSHVAYSYSYIYLSDRLC